MAKIYGLFGAMSGKVADVVMSVRNGQQIVRKYQPVVANPKTANQFSTRARFKLISQLSAIMATVIAIPRNGGVSKRNRFASLNFPLSSFNLETLKAEINLEQVQLTKGDLNAPVFTNVFRAANGDVSARIDPLSIPNDVSRIVYAAFSRSGDDVGLIGSSVVARNEENPNWQGNMRGTTADMVIYAYAVRDNTAAARLAFGNLEVPTATMVADLIVSRSLLESDVSLSRTSGYILAAGEFPTGRENEEVTKKKN